MLLILRQNPLIEVTTEDAADALVKCIKECSRGLCTVYNRRAIASSPHLELQRGMRKCKIQKYLTIIADTQLGKTTKGMLSHVVQRQPAVHPSARPKPNLTKHNEILKV